MIFNKLIENVEQMKLKNQKQSDLKIYFIYTLYSYRMRKKFSILIFLPKKSKTLADTWL